MKKMEERAREPSGGELTVKAVVEPKIPVRTRMAILPSPWLA